jgi:hypothetical protein
MTHLRVIETWDTHSRESKLKLLQDLTRGEGRVRSPANVIWKLENNNMSPGFIDTTISTTGFNVEGGG